MDKSLPLQVINGYLAVTGLMASMLFIRYIIRERKLGYEELRPAIMLLTLFVGTVVLRLPQFIFRTLANDGMILSQPNVSLFMGGLIVEGAFLCAIRIFSPLEWGHWPWIWTFLLSTCVVLLSALWVYAI